MTSVAMQTIQSIGNEFHLSQETMEACFENGTIEEKDALDDYHKLDHLEFKRDEINRFLQGLQ